MKLTSLTQYAFPAVLILVSFGIITSGDVLPPGGRRVHVDEYYYTNIGLMIMSHTVHRDFSFFRTLFPDQVHPPLAQMIMGLVTYPQGFGYNSFPWGEIDEAAIQAARFPSMVFGSLTVTLVFLLGKRLGNVRSGLFASSILMFDVVFKYPSRLAMLDVYVAFFSTLTFFLIIQAKDRSNKLNYVILAGISYGLLAASKTCEGPITAFLVASILLLSVNQKSKKKRFALFVLLGLATFFLVNPYMLSAPIATFQKMMSGITTPRPAGLGYIPVNMFNPTLYYSWPNNITVAQVILLSIALFWFCVQGFKRQFSNAEIALLAFFFFSTLPALLAFNWMRPIQHWAPAQALMIGHTINSGHFRNTGLKRIWQLIVLSLAGLHMEESIVVGKIFTVIGESPYGQIYLLTYLKGLLLVISYWTSAITMAVFFSLSLSTLRKWVPYVE